mgnify:CR=1 FL=1
MMANIVPIDAPNNENYMMSIQETARASAFIEQVYNLVRSFHATNPAFNNDLGQLVRNNGFTSVGGFVGTLGVHCNSFIYDNISASEFCKELFTRKNCDNPNANINNINYIYNFLIFIRYVNTISHFVEYGMIAHQFTSLMSTINDLVVKLQSKYP